MRCSYILAPAAREKLLQLFNDAWRTGTVPQVWREAIMIPILKRARTSRRLKATDQSALPVAWENWWNASSTQGSCGTLKTNSTSHQNKQLLGKSVYWGPNHLYRPSYPRCLPRQEAHTCSMDWPRKGIWQGVERGSQIETAPVWCCWANVQMDWAIHAQQESKSPDKAIPEPKENPQARRPTRWSAVPYSVPHLHPRHPASNAQKQTRSHLLRRPCVMVQWRIHHHCKLRTGCYKYSKWSSLGPSHGWSKWMKRKQLSQSSVSPTRSTVCTWN